MSEEPAASAPSVVMVDELATYGVATEGRAAQHFGAGKRSSHLTVRGDIAVLHALAKKIGLRTPIDCEVCPRGACAAETKARKPWCWFQPRSTPHYDVTPPKRDLALRHGAVFVSARDQARARLDAREAAQRQALAAEVPR